MKRNETTLGGSVKECVVPERITNEDRNLKSRNIECRVSNEYTIISGGRGPKYDVWTPWLLWSVVNSKEDKVESRVLREGEEDGGSPSDGGEDLEIMDGIAWLQVGSSLCSLTKK